VEIRGNVNAAAESTTSRGIRRGSSAFSDPLPVLPETAKHLLLAAKRILATHGMDALTLNGVSTVSGENKAMIAYYFGNKAGLVAAVLDSVIHDEYAAWQSRMTDIDPRRRRDQLIEEMRRMADASEEFRVFFEMLPYVLRDDALRARLALLYRWYWGAKLEWLGSADGAEALGDPDLLGLSQLLSAVIDGLAMQAAVDPSIDLANPFRIFARMLEAAIDPTGSVAGKRS